MMINCPNCNLLQQKDQYCARCGINMETWKPPQQPLWKKVLSNWMVQLGILFMIILAVVLKDSLRNETESTPRDNLPPVSREIERSETNNFAASSSEQASPSLKQVKAERIEAKGKTFKQIQEESGASLPVSKTLEKTAKLRAFLITRPAIERLASQSQKVEDMVFSVDRGDFNNFIRQNPRELKAVGRVSRSYSLGQPQELFIGERDIETDLSLGFFVQINVTSNSTAEVRNLEIRSWHQLKLTDEGAPSLNLETSLKGERLLLIIDPGAHDLEFSPEERNLFESSPYLGSLNDESFVESLSDIGLVLEVD